jgi:hypothetical protein
MSKVFIFILASFLSASKGLIIPTRTMSNTQTNVATFDAFTDDNG